MDFYKPINQNGSHLFVNVSLMIHVVVSNMIPLLFNSHIRMDVISIFSTFVWVAKVLKINFLKICLKLMNFILKFSDSSSRSHAKRWFIIDLHVFRWWLLLIGIIRRHLIKWSISILFQRKVNRHVIFSSDMTLFLIQNWEGFVEHWCSSLCSLLDWLLRTVR